ncbi:hypothetical protein LEP1GSC188_3244 [Leptospira weilii serovar Topaz str. LT2116]|uniref:Uncharacterized protein n=1 Tax=Leptospira weilii serovar Topaz str. LT2116 TaxID=1088540 RepID=M3FVW9_9LEPT|nr:hypothetical protein LEP1GSC188_3244 [Leptospira weilii serovar Topaz str. LT2116]
MDPDESELPPVFVFVSLPEEEFALVSVPAEEPELAFVPFPVEDSEPLLLEPDPTLDPDESELPPVFVFISLPEEELLFDPDPAVEPELPESPEEELELPEESFPDE